MRVCVRIRIMVGVRVRVRFKVRAMIRGGDDFCTSIFAILHMVVTWPITNDDKLGLELPEG